MRSQSQPQHATHASDSSSTPTPTLHSTAPLSSFVPSLDADADHHSTSLNSEWPEVELQGSKCHHPSLLSFCLFDPDSGTTVAMPLMYYSFVLLAFCARVFV